MFKRAANYRADLTQIEGLGDVIEGAGPHCLDRAIDRSLAADHHRDGIRRELHDVRQHFEAAHPRHRDIGKDEIEPLRTQQRQRMFRGIGRQALIRTAEVLVQDAADLLVVIDD